MFDKLKYFSFFILLSVGVFASDVDLNEKKNLTGQSVFPISGEVRKIVVFLHGYSGSGNCFNHYVPKWKLELPDTLFVAPNAPYVCRDVPWHGYQWWLWRGCFDYKNIRNGLEDVSVKLEYYINQLKEEHKIDYKDICLVGVSQGCMLSLEMIYRLPNIGGVLGYIGAFYPSDSLKTINYTSDILLVNGTEDQVIPYNFSLESKEKLEILGVTVDFHVLYGEGHVHANEEGLSVGCNYLKKHFFKGDC